MAVVIAIYADWEGLSEPQRLGILYAHRDRGREVFEFEFDQRAVENPLFTNPPLDPRLGFYTGRQHPSESSETFGVFADASPDRWGRMLMRRRLEREQRAGKVAKAVRLYESDYLLGVHDVVRSGGLRFRRDDAGDFLDNQHGVAAPPFVRLRALEAASLALERDEDNTEAAGNEWLRMLIAPGGSLGGARPKAVVDADGHSWIAKFPSVRDEHDVGGWELVVHALARRCGLRVSDAIARRFVNPHHTFLVKRFDRTDTGRRLHFASAMTLTGHKDGDDASTGASYLEIARVLIDHGVQTGIDLRELWSRIVFNLLVSNTDDHLRNHGFIMVPGKGWRLTEIYDVNPVPDGQGLRLNISEADNSLDLELALSVAPYFRVDARTASEIIERSRAVVRQWQKLADSLDIPASDQERLAPAFRLAG